MRALNRVLFLLFALVLLAVGAVLALFSSWRSERLRTLAASGEIAVLQTSAPLEYQTAGNADGPKLLVSHGAPGGYDQGLALGSLFPDFQTIAPSRPGYLRTPLSTGLTPEYQADNFDGLLDVLGLDKVVVLGFSAGAPAAIQFAIRQPERTRALILISPILQAYSAPPADKPSGLLGRMFTGEGIPDIAAWGLVESARRDPSRALAFFIDSGNPTSSSNNSTATQTLTDPKELAWFRAMVESVAPMTPRLPGLRNDIVQLRNLPELPFSRIQAPTLVIAGAGDPDVTPASLTALQNKLPAAQVVIIPDAGQWIFLGKPGETALSACRDFLETLTPSASNPNP